MFQTGGMKERRTRTPSKAPLRSVKDPDPTPALPAWKAFVVQFNRESRGNGAFAGRVEHLSSGRRVRFNSADELLAALRELLASVNAPPQ